MNLALFSSLLPTAGPAPQLAPEQVLFTPWLADASEGEWAITRRTPVGSFNLADAIHRLDTAQAPEAVAVLVDARCSTWPGGLGELRCPRVLLIADFPRTARGWESLADYIANEKFEHVVGLSDRPSAEALKTLGPVSVSWLPGWHFPHREAELQYGRKAQPQNRVAVCLQRGADDRQLLEAAKAAALRGLTVHARVPACRERPLIYGSSAVALVNAMPGDLRLVEALAAGAPCVAPRFEPESGWEALFPRGIATPFGDAEEAAEIASDLLANPAEAHAQGVEGVRWYKDHFSVSHRQSVFAALVLDNHRLPEFALSAPKTWFDGVARGIDPGGSACDVARAGVGASGYSNLDPEGHRAGELAEAGEFAPAFALAAATLKLHDDSWRSCLAIAEVAMETRQADLWRTMLGRARTLSPEGEGLARLELGSRGLLVEWRAMAALERAWEACSHGDWKAAIETAGEAQRRFPQCAEAAFLSGYAGVQQARQEKRWPDFAPALAALQTAVELAPHRSDFWAELATAQEQFKRELEQQPLTAAMRASGFPAEGVS